MNEPIGNKHAQLLMYRNLRSYFPDGEWKGPWVFTFIVSFFAIASFWEGAVVACLIRLWLEHSRGKDWAHLAKISTQLQTHDLTEEDKALSEKPLSKLEKQELDGYLAHAID